MWSISSAPSPRTNRTSSLSTTRCAPIPHPCDDRLIRVITVWHWDLHLPTDRDPHRREDRVSRRRGRWCVRSRALCSCHDRTTAWYLNEHVKNGYLFLMQTYRCAFLPITRPPLTLSTPTAPVTRSASLASPVAHTPSVPSQACCTRSACSRRTTTSSCTSHMSSFNAPTRPAGSRARSSRRSSLRIYPPTPPRTR